MRVELAIANAEVQQLPGDSKATRSTWAKLEGQNDYLKKSPHGLANITRRPKSKYAASPIAYSQANAIAICGQLPISILT